MNYDKSLDSSSFHEEENIKKRKVLIEDVITKDVEKAEPCLVQFSNGVMKNYENITGKLYRNASEKYIRKRKDRILKVFTPNLSYAAKNFGQDKPSELKERLFLGVLDEKTNKMRLVEMSSFLLHPDVKVNPTTTPPDPAKLALSYRDRQRTLHEKFGGRKGRSITRKQAQNEFVIEDMSGAIHEAFDTIDPQNVEDEGTKTQESYNRIIPACNREACSVTEVYDLSSIVTDQELLTFNGEAVEWLGESDQSDYSPLFAQTVANAKLDSKEEPVQAKIVCSALFTEKLIQLLKAGKSQPKIDPCPKMVKMKIFSTFTEGNMRKRTKTMEDKLIAHIIVLALLNNSYEIPFATLTQSLCIEKDRLEKMIQVVGATYKRDSEAVVLKLPLAKIYEPRMAKKSKRRFK